MQTEHVIELIQSAAFMALLIGAPLLIAGMIAGLVVSLLQALTQIQDQTLNLIPKIVVTILVLVFCLPWILDRMVEFTRESYQEIPKVIAQ